MLFHLSATGVSSKLQNMCCVPSSDEVSGMC
jgi:hypothetical protein